MNILLIEDDAELAAALCRSLGEQGCVVEHCADGERGLDRALAAAHRVVIVDRMLPSLDGLALVTAMRAHGVATPVIYLTTMGGIDDRVQGLEAGGDDYLVKPFAMAELLARVRVLARRASDAGPVATSLRTGPLRMDLLARTVERDGRPIDLLPQEFALLEYFMRNANKAVTRSMLLEKVWNIHFDPHTSVVESHISRLRAKLNQGSDQDLIQTIRGTGYRLAIPD
jgi:two-component system OmpR family response regulator